MALIALKWNNDFIRVAVATNSRSGARVQFDRALSVELASVGEEGEKSELSPAQLGDKLRLILEKVGVQKGDATVIVARRDVEMRQFQLPPVPSDELPEMVRFQARNHFTSFNDEFLVDFVPLHTDEQHSTVLAAALSGDEVQKIRETVEATGLRLRHIVVRPFAAAELVRVGMPDSECRVVLEIIGHEADISIVDNGYILMTRTVRVPTTYTVDQFDAWIPGEIQRTITAARGQAGAREVERIIVCGTETEHAKLAEELESRFDFPTSFQPPFDLIQKSGKFEQPAQHDGFASLMGSLVQSASEENHALDFLHPRRKPEKKIDKQKIIVGAAIAAGIALIGLVFTWWLFSKKDQQIADLRSEIESLEQATAITDPILDKTIPLDKWRARQVDWLEELFTLSNSLPDPDQTRLSSFSGKDARDVSTLDIRGFLDGIAVREVGHLLKESGYSVTPTQSPTKQEGFDEEYKMALKIPNSIIGPNGQVIRPDQLDSSTGDQPDTASVKNSEDAN